MIAFLDFDGTLITRESGVICALPSIRRGLLGARLGARLVGTYALSKLGLRTRTDAQRVGFECYAGRTLDELRAIMQALHDEHLVRHLSHPVIDRVERHKRAGERTVILTASAFFFAEPIARALGIDEVVGTQVEWGADGRCTGRVAGEIIEGEAKLAAARRVAEAAGVDLRRCAFYSDHPADLPLLRAVGRPVAVGPRPALVREARRRGWEIVEHA